jgi:hypothetical protein
MPHEIEVTIGPDGEVEFHVEGLKGKGCVPLLREFERALGKAVTDGKGDGVKHTVEYHQTETTATIKAK